MKKIRIVVMLGVLLCGSGVFAEATTHHLGLFLGATTVSSVTQFTAGVDYAYNLGWWENRISAIAWAEFITSKPMAIVLAAGLKANVFDHFNLMTGPGMEMPDGHNALVYRAGASYDFHMGAYAFSPTFYADFVKKTTALVYGLTVGRGF